jgi:hypothetical protein
VNITPAYQRILEALRAAPAPLAAKAVPMTATQVNELLDEGLIEANEESKYQLTEEGVFVIDHLYCRVPEPRNYDIFSAPPYVPDRMGTSRPGAMDFKQIPSHGACLTKELK